MRLFIAVAIPESVKTYLFDVQKKLPEADMKKTGDFHLTLKFLGSVDGNKIKEIESILEKIPFAPCTLQLDKIGIFGSKNYPRVVWAGVKVPQWMHETQKQIEARMEELGFEKENRFSPHLTLARIKFVKNPGEWHKKFESIQIAPHEFKADGFCLFESRLSPHGATYEILRHFPASAPP